MPKILIITADKQPKERLDHIFESMQRIGFPVVLADSWNTAAKLLEEEKFGAILTSKILRMELSSTAGFDLIINLLNQARHSFSKVKLAVIASDFTEEEIKKLESLDIKHFKTEDKRGVTSFCGYLPDPD